VIAPRRGAAIGAHFLREAIRSRLPVPPRRCRETVGRASQGSNPCPAVDAASSTAIRARSRWSSAPGLQRRCASTRGQTYQPYSPARNECYAPSYCQRAGTSIVGSVVADTRGCPRGRTPPVAGRALRRRPGEAVAGRRCRRGVVASASSSSLGLRAPSGERSSWWVRGDSAWAATF
jgi:hypothetical protein